MSDDPRTTAIGLDYFCDRQEELWRMADADVLRCAARELELIGFRHSDNGIDGQVHRFEDAYPLYDDHYLDHRETLKCWLQQHLQNVHPAGRRGLHNYNSQDHAMMSGLLAAGLKIQGTGNDPWSINTDQEYAEG